jgi:hypothetical protein
MAGAAPPEFYAAVDQVIRLANELTRRQTTARVSAVILYAAARYNAHCLIATDPDAARNRTAAIAYFVDQYKAMLEENVDEFLRAKDAPQRPGKPARRKKTDAPATRAGASKRKE